MITVFSCPVVGNHSLGSSYERYYNTTLSIASGNLPIASGARINSVTLTCSNITVWSSNEISGAHIRLDGTDFTAAQWSPRGDNISITKSCYTTTSIYAGKTSMAFWCGWDNTPTSTWCSFRNGGTLTLTINWDATDEITTYTSDVTAGNSASVACANSGYSHTAIWAFGTHSTSVSMAAGTTSASFSFPTTWLDSIPNAMYGNGTVTLITLSGQAEIGRVSKSVVFRCPSSPPLLTNLLDGATNKYGNVYLKGRTALNPTVDAAAQYYASIVSVSFNIPAGVLQSTGTYTLNALVKDSRGQTSTIYGTAFVVKDYQLPSLTIKVCNRCTSAGVDADDGTAIKVRADADVFEDGYSNDIESLTFAAKLVDDSAFGTEQPLEDDVQSIMTYRTFDTTHTYDVRIKVTDSVGGMTSIVRRINVTGYKMYVRSDGKGVAFGKACEHEKALEIPADWSFYKGNTIIGGVDPAVLLDLLYPVGSIYTSTTQVETSAAASRCPIEAALGGTWEKINGRFLFSADSSHAIGTTGGEATHTLTINEMPSHNHRQKILYNQSGYGAATEYNYSLIVKTPLDTGAFIDNGTTQYTNINTRALMSSDATGGGSAHNNMPPYLTVYMWKRTA